MMCVVFLLALGKERAVGERERLSDPATTTTLRRTRIAGRRCTSTRIHMSCPHSCTPLLFWYASGSVGHEFFSTELIDNLPHFAILHLTTSPPFPGPPVWPRRAHHQHRSHVYSRHHHGHLFIPYCTFRGLLRQRAEARLSDQGEVKAALRRPGASEVCAAFRLPDLLAFRLVHAQDFDTLIPGHGGVTDRFDCQFVMAVFTYVYYKSFVNVHNVQVVLANVFALDLEHQQEVRRV